MKVKKKKALETRTYSCFYVNFYKESTSISILREQLKKLKIYETKMQSS
jgi:hypothetical protein